MSARMVLTEYPSPTTPDSTTLKMFSIPEVALGFGELATRSPQAVHEEGIALAPKAVHRKVIPQTLPGC